MAFTQLVRPGAPVVFDIASSLSMQSGATTFGSPEPSHVLYACAQLAQRWVCRFAPAAACAPPRWRMLKRPMRPPMPYQTATLAGVNFMLHTAGWLEVVWS